MSLQTDHVPSCHGAAMVANAAVATPKRRNSKIPATVDERGAAPAARGVSDKDWPNWAWAIGIKGKLNKQIYKDHKVRKGGREREGRIGNRETPHLLIHQLKGTNITCKNKRLK